MSKFTVEGKDLDRIEFGGITVLCEHNEEPSVKVPDGVEVLLVDRYVFGSENYKDFLDVSPDGKLASLVSVPVDEPIPHV